MAEAVLKINDVSKRYGPTTALASVSFETFAGELFGLLGPNGAGKTTLLSIVSCLMEADGGEVRVLGQKASTRDRQLRRLIGIVPQELAVYGELTARENLDFFGSLYGLAGQALAVRVDEVLAAIGLSDRANHRVATFSGGMKRRLNLGAALVHRPRLLLLDEPTTGVDPQSRNHIFEEVRRVAADGVSVVYTSHYIEEVQALCSRIGIIDHGRLIACDELPVLLRQMTGLIRCRVPQATSELYERLRQVAGVEVNDHDGPCLVLSCRDVKTALMRLIAVLNELNLELVSLETTEPNLERVFLHLTGHALRD
ncbi:MAG TPA: ABC transporter ATP-binding protein [Pirellulales bacterium]|nr:ABC transporter ATP-binding protein [Pirellulales bacterium]